MELGWEYANFEGKMIKILLTILGICYALSPYDLLPDFLVGLGWLDDLIVLFLLWKYLYAPMKRRFSYADAYQRYRQAHQNGNRNGPSEDGSAESEDHSNRKGSQKDPWKILGIGKDASPEQIKKAYRELAMKYHPDRVMHLGEEFRALADKRFKEIQQAYLKLKPK